MTNERVRRPRGSISRTAVLLAATAWTLMAVLMVVNLAAAIDAHDAADESREVAADDRRQIVANRTILKHNRELAGAIGNAAYASYLQNACRTDILAENDTTWRRALNVVLDAYIRGDVDAARAALPALDAAAAVDIKALTAERCPR